MSEYITDQEARELPRLLMSPFLGAETQAIALIALHEGRYHILYGTEGPISLEGLGQAMLDIRQKAVRKSQETFKRLDFAPLNLFPFDSEYRNQIRVTYLNQQSNILEDMITIAGDADVTPLSSPSTPVARLATSAMSDEIIADIEIKKAVVGLRSAETQQKIAGIDKPGVKDALRALKLSDRNLIAPESSALGVALALSIGWYEVSRPAQKAAGSHYEMLGVIDW